MTTHFVGQRVRAIRTGATGVVAEFDHKDPFEMTVGVRMDFGGEGFDDSGKLGRYLAGDIMFDRPSMWEPILPSGHTAGHEGVCEELDKLLAGVAA